MSSKTAFGRGEAVDRGQFRLDRRRALQKLRNYRLPDPHHYILEFVKVANLLGASAFVASIGRSEVVIRIDGDPPRLAELDDLYSASFTAEDDTRRRALHHLAVGANAARAAGLSELTVAVGSKQPFAVRIGDEQVHRLDDTPSLSRGWEIHIKRRLHRALLVRFAVALKRKQLPEQRLLHQQARYSRTEVIANDTPVSQGLTLSGRYRALGQLQRDGESGVVGITAERHGYVLRVIQHGVFLQERVCASPFDPFGLRAVVDSSRVNTDLSLSAVVEDHAWDSLREYVGDVACQTVSRWLRELSDEELDSLRAQLRRLAVQLSHDVSGAHLPVARHRELLEVSSRLPVFERAIPESFESRHISIRDAICRRDGRKVVLWSVRRFGAWFGTDYEAPVLWLNPDDPAYFAGDTDENRSNFLQEFADEVLNITPRLEQLNRRELTRRKWRGRPAFELNARQIRSGRAGGCSVRVGLAAPEEQRRGAARELPGDYLGGWGRQMANRRSVIKVFFVKDDRYLGDRTIEADVGPFRIEVRGDYPVNDAFDGPDFDRMSLRKPFGETLRLFVELLEQRAFGLEVFCSLLGDVQDGFNRVFHCSWEDWPQSVLDTPLGIAAPLIERSSVQTPGAALELQLDRLGALAEEPVIEHISGQLLSLQQIYDRLSSATDPQQLAVLRDDRVDEVVEATGEQLVVVVPPFAQTALSAFFDCGSERLQRPTVPVGGDTSAAEVNARPGGDDGGGGSRSASLQLASRLAREQPMSKPAVDADSEQRNAAPHQHLGAHHTERIVAGENSETIPSLPRLLGRQLRRHVPAGYRPCIDDATRVDIVDRCGRSAVHVLEEGQLFVVDRAHPVVAASIRRANDPVARAFVLALMFDRRLQFDVEHGRTNAPVARRQVYKRQFLASLCTYLQNCDERRP